MVQNGLLGTFEVPENEYRPDEILGSLQQLLRAAIDKSPYFEAI